MKPWKIVLMALITVGFLAGCGHKKPEISITMPTELPDPADFPVSGPNEPLQ